MALDLEGITREDLDKLTKLIRINNAVLIANVNSNAWPFAKNIQSWIKQKEGHYIPLEEVQVKEFTQGEFRPQVMTNVRRKDVYFIQDSTEDANKWWVQLQLMEDLLHRASAESITFVIPDYLWGRQDSKDRPHVPISGKRVADSLIYADRVVSMEFHAKQIQSFFSCPIDVLQSFPVLIEYLKSPVTGIKNPSEWVVSSTDAGSAKMAESYYNLLGCHDVVFAYKKRNDKGKIEKILISGDVKGKNVLVVDDLDDTCGTKVKIAEELKRNGAKTLVSCSTHGLYAKGVEEILGVYDRVITTDTHNYSDSKLKKVEVVPTYPLFAQAIYNAQTGESISELFEVKNNGE
ncbi:MAG TPA: ribose-phosphate diphosphokinase [Patescibacteria group bacterium]|nr:ribose-phosphate diphosphokinase [Patescibacteria group bacterium]